MGGVEAKAGESDISTLIRGQGFDYDRISPRQLLTSASSDQKLNVGAAEYSILLVESFETAEPDWLAKIHEVAQAGVPVIWVGDKPKRSRGYRDHEARDSSVAELAQDVLGSAIQTSLGELEMALEQTAVVPPLSRVEDGWMRASATVRDTGDGYIVAVCNEYDRALVERIQIHLEYESARWMDPVTGETSKVESDILDLNLEAGRCQVLVTRSN